MHVYPGVSLITLAVEQVARSRAFYERLGWRCAHAASTQDVAFFSLNAVALALFDRMAFAQDLGLAAPARAIPTVALAQNHGGAGAVDRALSDALAAGAVLLKPAQATSWGGYHAMFADLDGHVWELAWNPHFPLAPDGTIELPH